VPVSAAEASALFADLARDSAIVLAVSGGPDSTALLVLATRWRASLKNGPQLLAVTIDHGLRPESAREARAVRRLAGRLGVRHRILRWTGKKPTTGVQEAARAVRYRLLEAAAKAVGARYVLTGHTLDDQAETVLFRLARGSGLSGLGAMERATPFGEITVLRPLLDLPKARLVATLAAIGISFADDPSNRDPRFARPRLRALAPTLASEGLDASRLALLARRVRRADAAIEVAVKAAATAVSQASWPQRGPIAFNARKFLDLPEEVGLRLLGRAIGSIGGEGRVQLGKLEALHASLLRSGETETRLRRTLAGALVALTDELLTISRAPARKAGAPRRRTPLTTQKQGQSGPARRG
jgi:tRNA(Ile)-lysidine synthase